MLYRLSYRNSCSYCFLVNSLSLRATISFIFFLHPLSPSQWPYSPHLISHCSVGQMQPAFPSSLEMRHDSFASIFVCTQGQETYTLWRICHVIPSQSLSLRSPWSHWTPRAKVRPHRLKSLKISCSAVTGSFLSCTDLFPISISNIAIWMPWGLQTAHLMVSWFGFYNKKFIIPPTHLKIKVPKGCFCNNAIKETFWVP